jgi:hypothetical protein
MYRTLITQRSFVTMGFLSFLFAGCTKESTHSLQARSELDSSKLLSAPPEVTSEQEDEGFHDLVLYVEKTSRGEDNSQSVHAVGTYKSHPLGIEVVLGPDWKAGSLGKDFPIATYHGTVSYRSLGSDSDAFLRALDELYETKVHPKEMAKQIIFTAISLEGDPRDVSKGNVKIKLFYESGTDEDYAELFTNVDLAAHKLEAREKDEAYRSAVVRALQPH